MGKNKKLFALLTLVCFLFTLMPVAAFANNDGVQQTNLLFEQNMARTTTDSGVKLTTPTGLSWGATPGDVQWGPVDGAEWYDVVVYHNGNHLGNKQLRQNVAACKMPVTDMINESGEYTFTVVAYGDGDVKSDASVLSAAYSYTRPSTELADPSNVAWDNMIPRWLPNNTYDDVQYYDMHYYVKWNGGHANLGWHSLGAVEADGYIYDRNPELVARLKQWIPADQVQDATVHFTVRAVSKNIVNVANSEAIPSGEINVSDLRQPLAAPANPQWENRKGNITWEPVDGAVMYDVMVFRNGNRVGNKQSMGDTALLVAEAINDSGDYTFTVTAYDRFGQKGATSVESPVYTYSRPSDALTAPGDAQWKSDKPAWQPSTPSDKAAYYTIHFRTGFTDGYVIGWDCWNTDQVDGYVYNSDANLDRLKDAYGNKPVLFSVRAVSENIEEIANSPVVYSKNAMNPEDSSLADVLRAPSEVKWADKARGIVEWNAVEGANGYNVHIMKAGAQVGMHQCAADFAPVAEGKYQLDVSGYIDGYGKYEVWISAKGDGNTTVTSMFRTSDVYDYKRPSSSGPSGGASTPSTPSQTTTSTTDSTTGTVTTTVTLSNGSAVSNTDSSVEIEIATVDKKVVKEVEKLVKSDDAVEVVGDEDNTVSISAENKVSGSSQESFAQPVGVSVKVDSKVLKKVNDTSKLTLAKVVTNEDGTTELVYMGGSYDTETGTFNAKVDEAGDYILVEKADLVKIELNIDKKDVKHNDKGGKLDVAPKINGKDGRTELPLRYLGEALGFDIEWNNNVVTIIKGNISFNLTIGQEVPGFGTPYIDSDRTMVSARYISEKLGAKVIWDPIERQVTVVK